MPNKVFIVNKSHHDYSDASKYGDIVFLSEGLVNRFNTNQMVREFSDLMEDSRPTDHIVLCSLNVMNSIATAVFAHRHGTLNLLLFKDGKYIERNLIL